jgi:predicted dehydrogenase
VHVPAFRSSDVFDVVALCGRDPARLARSAARLDVPEWSVHWEPFVRRPDLDVVSIASPAGLHADMFIAAIGAGKHVLCEKPFAADLAQARAMAAAAARSGHAAAVCFEYRFSESQQALRRCVASGVLGEIHHVAITRIGPYARADRPPQPSWMYRLAAGGGFLGNALSHDIDFVLDVFGPALSVTADVRTVVPVRLLASGERLEADADDTSTLILRLESGASALINSTFVASSSGYSLDIVGARGSIAVRETDGHATGLVTVGSEVSALDGVVSAADGSRIPLTGPDGSATRWTSKLIGQWWPAFGGGVSGAPTPAQAVRVQEVIEGARESSGGAGWVALGGYA